MKKQLWLLSLLCCAAAGCQAAPQEKAPVWSASADGFASVAGDDLGGTTGGAGGKVVTVDNLADLEKYALAPEPLVILIKGTITKEPFGKAIFVASNKTFLGLGNNATLLHGEFQLKPNTSNVIFRNLTIRDSWIPDDPQGKLKDFDGIQIDTSHHIWIDHCLLTHMEDGLIDFRKGSDYLTVSWSVLSNHNKAFGVGWTTDTTKDHVTLHHTWIHDTNQRNPSLDNGTGHLYNNWLQNITSYGNYSRGKSKVVVENSVFEKVNNPLICGPDAEMVSRGNSIKDSPTTDAEKTPLKGKAFDPKSFYSYSLDDAANVPDLLRQYGGPQASIGTPEMAAQMAALPTKPATPKTATITQAAPQPVVQPVAQQNAPDTTTQRDVKTINTTGNRVQQNIAYTQIGNETLHLDAYCPSGTGPFPVAIVIHGGGWGSGDKAGDTQPLCEVLSEANILCIAPDYRLSPAHRWPACFEDVQTALNWTKNHVAQFNGDPGRIALVGYSAGGQLACLTALQTDVAVKAVVALAAPTDLVADVKRRGGVSPALKDLIGAQELSPDVERRLAAMSPLNFIKTGLPPFLLLHGTADQSVPFAQSLAFQEKLRAAGTTCELHLLEAAPHRLSRWVEFDPHYTETMTTWLHQVLTTKTP